MAADRQRIKYWVNSGIQGWILVRIGFYWAVYHLILWHTMFVVRYLTYRAALMTGDVEQRSLGEIYETFTRDYASLAVCALVLAPIFLYDIFRNTHRIAGPLVRFQNSLQRITQGEKVEPFALRKLDRLTEFSKVFNEFLAFYNEQQAERGRDVPVMADHEAEVVQQIEKIRVELREGTAAEAARPATR